MSNDEQWTNHFNYTLADENEALKAHISRLWDENQKLKLCNKAKEIQTILYEHIIANAMFHNSRTSTGQRRSFGSPR